MMKPAMQKQVQIKWQYGPMLMNGPGILGTGCSLNIVFFPKILEYSGLWSFSVSPLGVSVCTHTGQVEHQRRSKTDRV